MYVSYTTDWPGVSVGHPIGAPATNCLWILWYGWLMLMGCSVNMILLLKSSTCPMFMQIPICRIWQFNSCMFMIISHCYIIKRHDNHAWYGCWTIKALVEAEVLWWLCCDSWGHSSSVDNCQTFTCLYIYKIICLSRKPILMQKCFTDTRYACTLSMASKRAIIEHWQKNFVRRNCLSVCDVHQCIVVIL